MIYDAYVNHDERGIDMASGYNERDRLAEPKVRTKPLNRSTFDEFDDDDTPDDRWRGDGVDSNYDTVGESISVELFNLQEAERVETERVAKELAVAKTIEGFTALLEDARHGTILYWNKFFERKNDVKLYRYAALYSDGLWWITGRHTHGRTTEAMITELIKMRQSPGDIKIWNAGVE